MRLFMNKQLIAQTYGEDITKFAFRSITNSNNKEQGGLCNCTQFRSNKEKQGYNDPSVSQNIRYAQTLTTSLGGRTMFGNFNKPRVILFNGGAEGQPGGMAKPLRNKF